MNKSKTAAEKSGQSRNARDIIHEMIVGPMRARCVDAWYGNDGGRPRVSIVTSEDELRGMTICGDFPHGLDFSTQDHSERQFLYEMRDDLQEVGLFFRGERGVGIRWTVYAQKGLAWRVEEWFERSGPLVTQIAEWCGIEAARTNNQRAMEIIQELGRLFRNTDQEIRQIHGQADALLTTDAGSSKD